MQEFLEKASDLYYCGHPIISDEEFDRLARIYGYNEVGHKITDGIPHLFRMYSLQKVFDKKDLPNYDFVVTPKLDGAAVSITYVEGTLAVALTRGDGNIGRDITSKLSELVPQTISIKGTVFITGEVVCPSYVSNARNVAAGSLNLKSLDEFRERAKDLVFVAYDVQGVEYGTWTSALNVLAQEGFQVVTHFDASDYPQDGQVYRVDNLQTFKKLGYTAHHPRGSYALKTQKEGVHTELLDVEWQVGKSGVVSPVAILAPVEVEGAIVGRATLHNIEYIRSLNLEIGCTVEVIRSGDIIPRVVRRIDLEKNSS